jgi:hypothetical protein
VRFTIRNPRDGAEYDLVGDHASKVFTDVYEPQGFKKVDPETGELVKVTDEKKADEKKADEKKS